MLSTNWKIFRTFSVRVWFEAKGKQNNQSTKMSEPQVKKSKTVSALDQLKALTTIVADTGDFEGMLCNNVSNIKWDGIWCFNPFDIIEPMKFGFYGFKTTTTHKHSIPFEYTFVRCCWFSSFVFIVLLLFLSIRLLMRSPKAILIWYVYHLHCVCVYRSACELQTHIGIVPVVKTSNKISSHWIMQFGWAFDLGFHIMCVLSVWTFFLHLLFRQRQFDKSIVCHEWIKLARALFFFHFFYLYSFFFHEFPNVFEWMRVSYSMAILDGILFE